MYGLTICNWAALGWAWALGLSIGYRPAAPRLVPYFFFFNRKIGNWIRLRLFNGSYPSWFDITTIAIETSVFTFNWKLANKWGSKLSGCNF